MVTAICARVGAGGRISEAGGGFHPRVKGSWRKPPLSAIPPPPPPASPHASAPRRPDATGGRHCRRASPAHTGRGNKGCRAPVRASLTHRTTRPRLLPRTLPHPSRTSPRASPPPRRAPRGLPLPHASPPSPPSPSPSFASPRPLSRPPLPPAPSSLPRPLSASRARAALTFRVCRDRYHNQAAVHRRPLRFARGRGEGGFAAPPRLA